MSIQNPMQYLVVTAFVDDGSDVFEALECEVQKYLDHGWFPCGGPTVVRVDDGTVAAQAITRTLDLDLPG